MSDFHLVLHEPQQSGLRLDRLNDSLVHQMDARHARLGKRALRVERGSRVGDFVIPVNANEIHVDNQGNVRSGSRPNLRRHHQ